MINSKGFFFDKKIIIIHNQKRSLKTYLGEILMKYLEFEKKIAALEKKIAEFKNEKTDNVIAINKLEIKLNKLIKRTYSKLTPWQTVQVARHTERPIFSDYLSMVKDFREFHGDRCFGDDRAIITGLGKIGSEKVLIIGQNKGKKIEEKVICNFGLAHPEGYRKALLKMKLAEKFNLPIITFIDTPGAYPGIGAEERGQARAIAVNLLEMSRLRVPIISIIIGEGGSGGALGLAVCDQLAMLEFAYFSVISPEGCAAILWKDGSKKEKAAKFLKLTSKELIKMGLIDAVIPEPLGGAHRQNKEALYTVEKYIIKTLLKLKKIPTEKLLQTRYNKLRSFGKIKK